MLTNVGRVAVARGLSKTQVPLPTRYQGAGGAVVGHNQGRFYNRPLYIANTAAFLLGGDRPAVRFASGDTLHGTFWAGLVRGGVGRWFHAADDLTVEYRAAHLRWVVRDAAWQDFTATVEVVALEEGVGFAARVAMSGDQPGDQLVWAFGGARAFPGKHLNWDLDPYVDPPTLPGWFDPSFCAGNHVRVSGATFTLAVGAGAAQAIAGYCDAPSAPRVCDADGCDDPAGFGTTRVRHGRLVGGRIPLEGQKAVTWSFTRTDTASVPRSRPKASASPLATVALAAGLARSAKLAGAVVVDTPEPRLNAAAAVLGAAVDGLWYPPTFRHGGMLWNLPFVGWRTAFGSTALGWHDRLKAHAKHYIGHQVVESGHRSLAADPAVLLAIPAKDSRFYGRGRIAQDQAFYDMQSQFFDQVVHAWQWTGDPELAAALRPALELHLEWMRECFDPEGDGLYESVINTWPTDSMWYGGGGGVEATAYAYRGHRVARDLARLAGDTAAVKRHVRQLARIRAAFHRRLWVRSKGRAGLYREPDGLRRLHDDPWLYSIFLPIDVGLVDREQAVESLLHAERELQNDAMPAGGRRVWTSNLVPSIWSVREVWPGDNYHLALAYFQAGMAQEGWDVFRGTLLHSAFNNVVPGDFGDRAGGTDFGDCVHMAARTLVEGLFGFAPDRAHGIVRLAPQFPAEWHRASIRTADVTMRWTRRGAVTTLTVELPRPARWEIRLPVCARDIRSVTLNGRPVRWTTEPGFGHTIVVVNLPESRQVAIELTVEKPRPCFPPMAVKGRVGDAVAWSVDAEKVLSVRDPQGVLERTAVRGRRIAGRLRANPGNHTVIARVRVGKLPQLRRILVAVTDPIGVRRAAAKRLERPPGRAKWSCVDLGSVLNGDIRTIYAQRYLSPRPATMSARIGTDGYSPWTFPFWKSEPPVIGLDQVPALLEPATKRLRTPQGVPFNWPGERRNIAFTSRWDNWPRRVTVPVGMAGDAVWLLVAGSTNPMQGRIANAVLRLRFARGGEERIELVPPVNYWNLSPIRPNVTAPLQFSRQDYTSEIDTFAVPKPWPQTVQLGANCRGMVIGHRLPRGIVLKSVTLETLSPEVVVGLMGVSVMNPG